MEPSSRPQRTAALSTMSAILIATSSPPFNKAVHKPLTKNTPKVSNATPVSSVPQPSTKNTPKGSTNAKPVSSVPQPSTNLEKQRVEPKSEVEVKLEPSSVKLEQSVKLVPVVELLDAETETEMEDVTKVPVPVKVSKKATPTAATPTAKPDKGESVEEGKGEALEEEEEVAPVVPTTTTTKGRRKKGNSNKFVNIPSIEYPVSLAGDAKAIRPQPTSRKEPLPS